MLKTTFKKEDIKKAIEILASECYGAMSMCNMIGGIQSPEWEILHNNTWTDIVNEGISHGLDFDKMTCAVSDSKVSDSATIQFALGKISDVERRQIFYKYIKNGDGKWPLIKTEIQ